MGQVQVIPKIESYLDDLNMKEHDRRLGVFSASDIGTRGGHSPCGRYTMGCNRVLYYRYIGEEPKDNIDPRLRRIFDTGSKVHEQLQEYMEEIAKKSGGLDLFVKEAKSNEKNSIVAYDHEISSTTDGIWEVSSADGQVRFGIEIKSMKGELFKDLNKAHGENIVQSHVYMACLDLPAMTILYYNKNDSGLLEFRVPFDKEVWEAILAKLSMVRDYALKNEPPPREPGFHCRNCRYAHICKPPKVKRQSLSQIRHNFGKR